MINYILRHYPINRLTAALLAVLLTAAAHATSAAAAQQPAPKINLIIEHNAVRFELQTDARAWQLEIFNQDNGSLFSSGVVSGRTSSWPLDDRQGKPVQSGLYIYSLSFWNESNEPLPTQRGYLIVNRADAGDRIWIASSTGVGVGGGEDLTFVGAAQTTVGGMRLPTEQTSPGRETAERAQAEVTHVSSTPANNSQLAVGINSVGNISGDGTAGRIAKFLGPDTIGNSGISETSGKISIGTTATMPSKLYVYEAAGVVTGNTSIHARNQSSLYNPFINGTIGVFGESVGNSSVGVLGSAWTGVYGSGSTYGVRGVATGDSLATRGVYGESDGGSGVYGAGKIGVQAHSNTGIALAAFGECSDCLAGHFDGDVEILGWLYKAGGSFKIDHPLDPANKYLYHAFVESPEMMNIYNGVVTLDTNGQALVTLPSYFEALNRDFRYQLTCVGGFAPVYIAEEIARNHFKIAGGKPGIRVSWQVTGVRQDAFANKHRMPVEQDKPEAERGYYLYPRLFNQPEEQGISRARLAERVKKR